MRALSFSLLGLGLMGMLPGCDSASADADGDGLSDSDEEKLGTDPDAPDSDNDGLEDGEEVDFGSDPLAADADEDGLADPGEQDAGTDPNAADSDDDGYRDGDEITEGSDPTDASSLIYVGGWPYNPNKGDMEDPGWDGRAAQGKTLPNFIWPDQYDDLVNIYDFAQQGKPMVLDVSTIWCGWCRVMAAWLGGDMSEAQEEIDQGYDFEGYYKREDWWDLVPELVQNGDIYWVTVITQNARGGAAKQSNAEDWATDFPNPMVPVLADEETVIEGYLDVAGYPTLFMLDENLQFTVVERNDYTAVLNQLVEDFGS